MSLEVKTTVRLKLLVDKQKGRVVFAEGRKDFIDFLFIILTLPLGTVVKLLTKSSMAGSLGKLYESVENLDKIYMQPGKTKDTLLRPKTSYFNPKTPLLQSESEEYSRLTFYKCSNILFSCNYRVSSSPRAICPTCRRGMSVQMSYVAPPTGTGVADGTEMGYVNELVPYMITDDLEVKPLSTTSAITLLNGFNVKQIGGLEEIVVDIGTDEALKILKASLKSKTVLTDVFLGRKTEALDMKLNHLKFIG